MRLQFMIPLLILAGCASTVPTRYYTLDMRPAGAAAPVNLEVGRLHSAEAVSGKDILIHKSPTEVEFYATGEWVAGLDELVADKLYAEFGPPRPGKPGLYIEGEIKNFEQVDTPGGAEAYVKLKLNCEVKRKGIETKRFEKTYEARRTVESQNNSMVRGLSIALSRCMEDIAAQLAGDAMQR